MKFNFLAGTCSLEFANERECPAAYAQMLPIMLDPTDLVEGVFVEEEACLRLSATSFDQTASPVIQEQVRMDSGQISRVFERKEHR